MTCSHCGGMTSVGLGTSARWPSSTAPACWTVTAGSGSRPSAGRSRPGCTCCPGSGSCWCGPHVGWAGRCGWTPHPSSSPITSGSFGCLLQVTRRSFCWRARGCADGGWILHGRAGRRGSCPALRRGGSACSCGCTMPWPMGSPAWPPSARFWILPPIRPCQLRRRGHRRRSRRQPSSSPTTRAGASRASLAHCRASPSRSRCCGGRGAHCRCGARCSPSSVLPAPASTARSARTAGWTSSAPGSTLPKRSLTRTRPRSTTSCSPSSPVACAICCWAEANTSVTWCCGRWCRYPCTVSSPVKRGAIKTQRWSCRCRSASLTQSGGCS